MGLYAIKLSVEVSAVLRSEWTKCCPMLSISSSDLKSRPTLIRRHFCLHDVVRETLHRACATVGKKVTTTQFSVSSCQGENI